MVLSERAADGGNGLLYTILKLYLTSQERGEKISMVHESRDGG